MSDALMEHQTWSINVLYLWQLQKMKASMCFLAKQMKALKAAYVKLHYFFDSCAK